MTVISYLIKALQRLMWNILRNDSFLLNGILEKGLKKKGFRSGLISNLPYKRPGKCSHFFSLWGVFQHGLLQDKTKKIYEDKTQTIHVFQFCLFRSLLQVFNCFIYLYIYLLNYLLS